MEKLQELAEVAGISSSYIDKVGNIHYTDDDVRRFFLKNMGYAADNDEQTEGALRKLQAKPLLPDVLSFYDNEVVEFSVNRSGNFDLRLTDENNICVWQQTVSGGQKIQISNLKIGYYTLELCAGEYFSESLLIYAPEKCWQPEFLREKEHIFGTAVMLYALHSANSMGIGDFSDLAEIVRLTAQNGGDSVGINPLGVMSPYTMSGKDLMCDVSPYRTLSRLFVNYIYLDLRAEDDFKQSSAVQKLLEDPAVIAEINRLNDGKYVEYAAVLCLKLRFLEQMFVYFKDYGSPERQRAFTAYITEKGDELDNLAAFEVLLEKMVPADYWRNWPEALANVSSFITADFKRMQKDRMMFYKYCHWLADIQVKNVQRLALSLGMKIGLYTDMPIGAASNGAEVWENQTAFVLDAGIGAPADPMRPRGQSWGFTPYHPQKLAQQKYAPFIRLVRENMCYSGALRFDHAMGLRRLFWGFFTEDNPVVQGAYVYYNIKDMVAIVALESVRHKCLVIGEDLGTVPEGFREYMAEHGLLSYKVFCRQKEKDGSFIAPEKYMYLSLAQPSTHDQATACGFWTNEDIYVFERCGLYVNQQQYQENLDGRRCDRENMIKAFAAQNMATSEQITEMTKSAEFGENAPAEIELLLNQYCARTNSALVLVRLNDIYRQRELDNAPGTVSGYPNWRLKMSVSVEDIKNSPSFSGMMKIMKENRPKTSPNSK